MSNNDSVVKVSVEHEVSRLDAIQKSIDAQRELGAETGELQQQFEALQQQLNSNQELQALVGKLQSLQRELEANTAAAAELAAQQIELQASAAAAAQSQQTAAANYDAAAQRVDALTEKISGHRVTIAALQEEQVRNTAEIRTATEAYGGESQQVAALKTKADELKQSIAEQRTATQNSRSSAPQSQSIIGAMR